MVQCSRRNIFAGGDCGRRLWAIADPLRPKHRKMKPIVNGLDIALSRNQSTVADTEKANGHRVVYHDHTKKKTAASASVPRPMTITAHGVVAKRDIQPRSSTRQGSV